MRGGAALRAVGDVGSALELTSPVLFSEREAGPESIFVKLDHLALQPMALDIAHHARVEEFVRDFFDAGTAEALGTTGRDPSLQQGVEIRPGFRGLRDARVPVVGEQVSA